ncbi:hypothetical protein TrST_g2496 [Triparma strigata]|nr:hypothetical protein TrST_g2496 [Triparma strigata]
MSTASATLKDLSSALHSTLHYKGTISKLTSMVRAEVHSCLDMDDVPPPVLPNENLIINELILEYLQFNGYGHAASVLRAESGQPKEGSVDVHFVKSELGVSSSSNVPTLYGCVEVLKKNKSLTSSGMKGLKQFRAYEKSKDKENNEQLFQDDDDEEYTEEITADGSAWARKTGVTQKTSSAGITGRLDPEPLVFGGY